jgi:hypothetical protein
VHAAVGGDLGADAAYDHRHALGTGPDRLHRPRSVILLDEVPLRVPTSAQVPTASSPRRMPMASAVASRDPSFLSLKASAVAASADSDRPKKPMSSLWLARTASARCGSAPSRSATQGGRPGARSAARRERRRRRPAAAPAEAVALARVEAAAEARAAAAAVRAAQRRSARATAAPARPPPVAAGRAEPAAGQAAPAPGPGPEVAAARRRRDRRGASSAARRSAARSSASWTRLASRSRWPWR